MAVKKKKGGENEVGWDENKTDKTLGRVLT
jgi:hypothetical protein